MTVRRLSALVLGNCAVLVIMFILSEGGYRLLHPEQELYARTFPQPRDPGDDGNDDYWTRRDPDLGWVASGGNLHTFTQPTAKWSLRVNRQGFRSPVDYDAFPAKGGAQRIMMLGDSFVFGVYVEERETLPAQLEALLGTGFQAFNVSSPGWGLDQMYLAYEKFVEAMDPDVVVLVYINDDVRRVFESDSEGEKPSFKLVRGTLVSRAHDTPGWWDWLAARSHIANHAYARIIRPYESERITKAIVRALAAATSGRGQRFVALRYPDKTEVVETFKEWDTDLSAFFADEGIPHLDPLPEMRALRPAERNTLYLDFDEHPAAAGHAFVARYLAERALNRR